MRELVHIARSGMNIVYFAENSLESSNVTGIDTRIEDFRGLSNNLLRFGMEMIIIERLDATRRKSTYETIDKKAPKHEYRQTSNIPASQQGNESISTYEREITQPQLDL
uniref:Resolvase/invertase-type recombinase catalytic domain-containing protein n=1 Tax=Rhabditophanes sp. KR3021 TaxID=114890 RepID=A0AC35TJ49_9BILA